MQHIINLSINTVTYEIFQAIECLRNFLEYHGSRDAHFKFQNGGNASRLKHNARRLQSYNETSCFRRSNCVMAAGFTPGL